MSSPSFLFIININYNYFYAKCCIFKKRLYICTQITTNKYKAMKTIKDLNKQLVSKEVGCKYSYEINNTRFEINEFNGNKGWALNEFKKGAANSNFNNEWLLINSYGYNGLTLKSCKEMILMQWNSNEIK